MANATVRLLLILNVGLLLSACISHQTHGLDGGEPQALPRVLAVLPAVHEPAPEAKENQDNGYGPLVLELTRSFVANELAGRGYEVIPLGRVDDMVAARTPAGDWRAADPVQLAEALGADGLVRITLTDIRASDALVYEEFRVTGQLDLVDKAGQVLGPWPEEALARDLSIPTGPVSAAALVFETAVDEPMVQKIRNLAFSWGALAVEHFAPSPHAPDLPEIQFVEANVQEGVFGQGRLVAVRMRAEPGLTATFSLGDYRADLPLEPMEPGMYVGVYQVRPLDEAHDLPLVIRMVKAGVERVWMEPARVTLDGRAPDTPGDLKALPLAEGGVRLDWSVPPDDDLCKFVLQRSDQAAGEWATVADTREDHYVDRGVLQEETYYYRVLAEDAAGNRSHAGRPVQASTPRLDPAILPAQATGKLTPGPYLVTGRVEVPDHATLKLPAGTELRFDPGASLVVNGALTLAGREELPVVLSGTGWHGILVNPGGRLVGSQVRLKGCESCVTAEGAEVALSGGLVIGDHGTGLDIVDAESFALEGLEVRGFNNGVVLANSRGHLIQSTIRENSIGVTVVGGDSEITLNDISGNGVDVASDAPLVLRENYLGSTNPAGLNLEGPVEVKSLLTDKPPYGSVVNLELTPEERTARFEELKRSGAAAFAESRFGDAYESLAQALSLLPDRDVFLLLAYTRQAVGEDPVPTLEAALENYPRDVRIHALLARELAARGEMDRALQLVQQGLAFEPGHAQLLELRDYIARLQTPTEVTVDTLPQGAEEAAGPAATAQPAPSGLVEDSVPSENLPPEPAGETTMDTGMDTGMETGMDATTNQTDGPTAGGPTAGGTATEHPTATGTTANQPNPTASAPGTTASEASATETSSPDPAMPASQDADPLVLEPVLGPEPEAAATTATPDTIPDTIPPASVEQARP